MKTEIVERLGERAVLLPSLIGVALAANDRIKLRLSLLQEAASHAQTPSRRPQLFRAERQATPLDAPNSLVADAHSLDAKRLFAPGVSQLLAGMKTDVLAMLAPLQSADGEANRPFIARADTLMNSLPTAEGDELDFQNVDDLVSTGRADRDSIHALVMDLHKALNRLAADTAPENLDGASVHRLDERDRARVKAFMRGLNRTAHLAFGHPGLATTAVRANGRLTIQNDIGATDAHVLVIHIEDRIVTVTYTDTHRPRTNFFISLFENHNVTWGPLAERTAEGFDEDFFYLLTGRYGSDDGAAIERFLEFLGSRIVFLIDWNKARKALQTFVGKNAAIDLLVWAAAHDFGHRAFLVLGGADLIFEAVHHAAAGRIPYGIRLDAALGPAECVEFLQRVLRDSSQGLSADHTTRLIRDQIQADLSRRFETTESSVLTVLVRHLGLSRILAGRIADVLSMPDSVKQADRRSLAHRAKQLEEKADRLTVSAREIAARIHEPGMLRLVIDEVENTADALEDCAYYLSLVPEADAAALSVVPLVELSEIVIDSVGNLVRAIEAASRLPRGERADAVASLQAIDAVVNAERSADAAERDAFGAFMAVARPDYRVLVLGLEIARALETATDHLSHSALSLRDRVLAEISA